MLKGSFFMTFSTYKNQNAPFLNSKN